jgi:hypothetical protein
VKSARGRADRRAPTLVVGLQARRVVQLAAGGAHSLALDEGGALLGWGANHAGQLGLCRGDDLLQPVLLRTMPRAPPPPPEPRGAPPGGAAPFYGWALCAGEAHSAVARRAFPGAFPKRSRPAPPARPAGRARALPLVRSRGL